MTTWWLPSLMVAIWLQSQVSYCYWWLWMMLRLVYPFDLFHLLLLLLNLQKRIKQIFMREAMTEWLKSEQVHLYRKVIVRKGTGSEATKRRSLYAAFLYYVLVSHVDCIVPCFVSVLWCVLHFAYKSRFFLLLQSTDCDSRWDVRRRNAIFDMHWVLLSWGILMSLTILRWKPLSSFLFVKRQKFTTI